VRLIRVVSEGRSGQEQRPCRNFQLTERGGRLENFEAVGLQKVLNFLG
jgi:hypothetical protein